MRSKHMYDDRMNRGTGIGIFVVIINLCIFVNRHRVDFNVRYHKGYYIRPGPTLDATVLVSRKSAQSWYYYGHGHRPRSQLATCWYISWYSHPLGSTFSYSASIMGASDQE